MIAILAYGSLKTDLGEELNKIVIGRKPVETPFPVEYARKSGKTRHGAPTLAIVENGGSKVKADLLILQENVNKQEAINILYRRETNRVGSKEGYSYPSYPNLKNVFILEMNNFPHFEGTVLYTKIEPLNAKHLADLAIRSTRSAAGDLQRDGIHYLINALSTETITPLTKSYVQEILTQTGAQNLEEAFKLARMPILFIIGTNHHDPIGRVKLAKQLQELKDTNAEAPKFIAVESNEILLKRMMELREEAKILYRLEWQNLPLEMIENFATALYYEGDSHQEIFPDSNTIWLDKDKSHDIDLSWIIADRINDYNEFFDKGYTTLESISSKIWQDPNISTIMKDPRNTLFADLILKNLDLDRGGWAIAVVGYEHTRTSKKFPTMTDILIDAGVNCQVVPLST